MGAALDKFNRENPHAKKPSRTKRGVNSPPHGAKRFAHASTKKGKVSQIPLDELNQWGYPDNTWKFEGFFNGDYSIGTTTVRVGFSYFVKRGDS